MQHTGGSDVIQSVSHCLAPCQSIVHDQQRLVGFQRQLYRLDFAVSKARRKRSSCRYRHHVQPSLVRGLFDSSAVHSCFLPASEPDRLRNTEPGEQISWNEQRVDLGEGDQSQGRGVDFPSIKQQVQEASSASLTGQQHGQRLSAFVYQPIPIGGCFHTWQISKLERREELTGQFGLVEGNVRDRNGTPVPLVHRPVDDEGRRELPAGQQMGHLLPHIRLESGRLGLYSTSPAPGCASCCATAAASWLPAGYRMRTCRPRGRRCY